MVVEESACISTTALQLHCDMPEGMHQTTEQWENHAWLVPDVPALVSDELEMSDVLDELHSDLLGSRATRKVSFATTAHTIESASHIVGAGEEDEEDDMWYSRHELALFRLQARELSRTCLRFTKADVVRAYKKVVPSMARDEFTRGLEQRCAERQRRRFLVTLQVVSAQSKVDSQQLAVLYHRCSSWAVKLACKEAARDFRRAYLGDDDTIDGVKRLMGECRPEASFHPRKRRSVLVVADDEDSANGDGALPDNV